MECVGAHVIRLDVSVGGCSCGHKATSVTVNEIHTC